MDILELIGWVAIVSSILFFVIELIHSSVFGLPIKDSELDVYLLKYLPQARLNPYSTTKTILSGMPKYAAIANSLLTKWHISDYGTIPRWSKWSKILDKKRASLLVEEPEQTLSQL